MFLKTIAIQLQSREFPPEKLGLGLNLRTWHVGSLTGVTRAHSFFQLQHFTAASWPTKSCEMGLEGPLGSEGVRDVSFLPLTRRTWTWS